MMERTATQFQVGGSHGTAMLAPNLADKTGRTVSFKLALLDWAARRDAEGSPHGGAGAGYNFGREKNPVSESQ